MAKYLGIFVLAVVVSASGVELGTRLSFAGIFGFVSSAEAASSRSMSSMDVQGVSARTVRSCTPGTRCKDSDRGRGE